MVRNYTLFFVMSLAMINCGVMGMESGECSPLDMQKESELIFDSETNIVFQNKKEFEEWRERDYAFRSLSEEGAFVTPRSKKRTEQMKVRQELSFQAKHKEVAAQQQIVMQQAVGQIAEAQQLPVKLSAANITDRRKKKIIQENSSEREEKQRLITYDNYNNKHELVNRRSLPVPSGKGILFVHAVKNQDVSFIIPALEDPMLQVHPFVKLLKPVYSNQTCELWVPEQLLFQVPYSKIAGTAALLALNGKDGKKNMSFMREYTKEMKRQKDSPVYKICN